MQYTDYASLTSLCISVTDEKNYNSLNIDNIPLKNKQKHNCLTQVLFCLNYNDSRSEHSNSEYVSNKLSK